MRLTSGPQQQTLVPGELLPNASSPLDPFDSIPEGLRQLHDLAEYLAKYGFSLGDNFRVVVSVPTQRLASTALALGAMSSQRDCDSRCGHRVTGEDPRPASLYDNRHLRDQDAWRDERGRVWVSAQNHLPTSRGIHLLPSSFPQRGPASRGQIFEDEVDDLARAMNLTSAQAGIERSELGAHPVIVVGYVSRSYLDVKMPRSPLAWLHPLGRLAPGKFGSAMEPGWYRHPVLLANRLRNPDDEFAWLSEVEPRLVVYVGTSAVRSSVRDIWPRTPAVIVLSRRANASANALELVESLGWQHGSVEVPGSVNPFRPQSGLEISSWAELGGSTPEDAGDEGPEW
jgi:hypothetical protein